MGTDSPTSAHRWRHLVTVVADRQHHADTEAALALAMSLGSAITPDSLACSVTQVTPTGYRTPVWSDSLALDLDRAQYDAGDGPCVATAQDGQLHTIAVMVDEPRYEAFTAAAVRRGVRCSLSVPLSGGAARGALNLYARTSSAYEVPHARATVDLLARCVGTLLAGDPGEANPGLAAALERRDQIHRAQAELVRRGAADQDAAFLRLTELSRSENRSIFAIVADLVRTVAVDAGSSPQAPGS